MADTDGILSTPITGGCVCGEVRFTATQAPLRVTICHCVWCQKRTGSAFGVEAVFNEQSISIEGDALQRYIHHSDESGRWLQQKFCSACGSNIGLTLEAAPGIQSVAAGLFDDPSILESASIAVRHVFTRSARSWVVLPDGVEKYEKHFRA